VVCDGKALAFDYADARLEMAERRGIEKVPRFALRSPTFASR
jgi:hypothetical protein